MRSTHLMQLQPYQPGTMRRTGKPWSRVSGAPFMRTASIACCSSSRVKIQLAPATDVRHVPVSSSTPETRTRDAPADGRMRSRTRRERNPLPVGGAHQAVVGLVGVARALDQDALGRPDVGFEIAEAKARRAPPPVRRRAASRRRWAAGWTARRCGRRSGRPGCRLRIADCGWSREVGEQPRVEAVAEQAAEWRRAAAGVAERHHTGELRVDAHCLREDRSRRAAPRKERRVRFSVDSDRSRGSFTGYIGERGEPKSAQLATLAESLFLDSGFRKDHTSISEIVVAYSGGGSTETEEETSGLQEVTTHAHTSL